MFSLVLSLALSDVLSFLRHSGTRPRPAAVSTTRAIGLAIPRIRHAMSLLLADHGVERFPELACGKELILMTSHEDVRLWTGQDGLWLHPFSRNTEDRPVSAIVGDHWMLHLTPVLKIYQWRERGSALTTFPKKGSAAWS